MAIGDKLHSIAEFERYLTQHPDTLLELIDGSIIEKMTSEEHGKIVINIGSELRLWLKSNPNINGHYSTEASYQPQDDDHNERRPDVSFRITDETVSAKTRITGMPDFAVEVKSRNNSYDELRDKARFYITHGTQLVWLVYPEKRIVEVYFADGTSELFTDDDTLSGGDTLPDFTLRVSEIFD